MSFGEVGGDGSAAGVSLPTPAYHRALAEHLTATEPELWAWFAESSAIANRTDDSAEVALLKSAYRLDGGIHDVLNGHATLLASTFGIDEPVVLYQALGDEHRNARVFRLNGQIHVVFSGDLLDLLSIEEQHAILAHELAHIALWNRDEQRYFVLDHLIHRLASEPTADDAVVETARRLRLHTEVWADAAATVSVGEVGPVVSAMVKVSAGLRNVDPDAYLRQAAQILEADSAATEAWTHPELHVRVACVEARNRGTAENVIDALVNGPDDLDRLDLLGQLRLQTLTARVLSSGAAVLPASDGVDAHLRSFADLQISNAAPFDAGELTEHQPSVRWMAAALLVDLAFADGASDGLDDLRALSAEAARQGTGDEFDKILARATDRTPVEAARIREVNA